MSPFAVAFIAGRLSEHQAIDPKVPSINFTGPNGWAYSTRVEEKNNLDKVKVGDKVDITWTSAALIAFEE